MNPVLAELCCEGACSGITATPLADIAQLAGDLRAVARSRGACTTASGHRHALSASESDLLGVLQAGDLNPALRALLPAAVRSALRGDAEPAGAPDAAGGGSDTDVPGAAERKAARASTVALNATTICEEAPFPWSRGDPPAARQAEAMAALSALPSSAFYPFDANLALAERHDPGLRGLARRGPAAAGGRPAAERARR